MTTARITGQKATMIMWQHLEHFTGIKTKHKEVNMELKIKGNLTMGKLRRQEVSLSTEYVSNNGIFGGQVTNQYPVPCYRCSGTRFHICRDGDDLVSFCANDACLKQDSDASKADERKRYAERQERNQYGQVITGAEKFMMGSSYKHACLASWVASPQLQNEVNLWMKDSRPFLLVMGNPGTGKTFLSASVLNLLFEKKEEVFYTTHRRFIEEIHKAIEENKTQHSVIQKICDKRFLIFDDLGAATCSDWQKEMILELIDRRYSDNLKTLITTNFNEKEITEMLGLRTKSRLFDQHNAILQMWTSDKRRDPEYKNT